MPRGGPRPGAGRPRRTASDRKRLEKTLQDGSTVIWGWHDNQLVSLAASGEYAEFLRHSLLQKLEAEEQQSFAIQQLEALLKGTKVAMSITIGIVPSPESVRIA